MIPRNLSLEILMCKGIQFFLPDYYYIIIINIAEV